jgi:hypothetical protein
MIVPYIGWPFLFFMKDKIDHYIYNKKEMYNLKKLYYQILIGCGIYGIFWFIFNLIFLSLFFTVIIFTFKNKFIQVLFILCIIDYFIQITPKFIFLINSKRFLWAIQFSQFFIILISLFPDIISVL